MITRSRIVFDHETESTPYDRDRHLTQWRLVGGGGTYPADGLVGPAQEFAGTAGFEADDLDSVYTGLKAITVRILIKPRLDDMGGATATLISRGRGGPTAGEYWAWQVNLKVNLAGVATLQMVWQDDGGNTITQDLLTFQGDEWILLSVTRETPTDTNYLRAVRDGIHDGQEFATLDSITATPGEVITLGCRRNGASYDQFYYGLMDVIEIRDAAVTPLQERHHHAELIDLPSLVQEAAKAYWFQGGFKLIDSDYERYRLQTVARILSSTEAAVMRRSEAGLPDTAYDERLEMWEQSLAIPENRALTIAERQARAKALIALIEGLSDEAMKNASAAILGVDPSEVSIEYCSNDIVYKLENHIITYASDIGDRDQLEGARVSGNIDCSWTGSALLVQPVITTGGSGEYHSPANEFGAGFTERAVDPSERASIYARMKPDPSNPTSISRWVGLCMRRGNHVFWVAASESLNNLYAYQSSGGNSITVTDLGTLPASASGTYDIAIMYEDLVRESSDCPLRVRVKAAEDGIDDWQETTVNAALPDSPQWMGFSLVMGITINVETEIQTLRLQWRDHATSFYWHAIVPTLTTDPVAAAVSLQRKNRASAKASYSKDAVLTADSPGSFADYTPTICGES